MHHLIFSASALLGTDIVSPEGAKLGALEDIICNKDTGKITYLIVSAGRNLGFRNKLYALHHSFFYLNGDDEVLIFDTKIGKDDHNFYLDLPDHYDDATVHDFSDFSKEILLNLSVAGHRSDNE